MRTHVCATKLSLSQKCGYVLSHAPPQANSEALALVTRISNTSVAVRIANGKTRRRSERASQLACVGVLGWRLQLLPHALLHYTRCVCVCCVCVFRVLDCQFQRIQMICHGPRPLSLKPFFRFWSRPEFGPLDCDCYAARKTINCGVL